MERKKISSKKLADLIESLLISYGNNGKKCSNRHLAIAIDPEAEFPPANAVARWLKQTALPNPKLLAGIARVANMTVPELENYLADHEVNTLPCTEEDFLRCEAVVCQIAMGKKVDPKEKEATDRIIENLSVPRLRSLYKSISEKLKEEILRSRRKKLRSIVEVQSLLHVHLFEKIDLLAYPFKEYELEKRSDPDANGGNCNGCQDGFIHPVSTDHQKLKEQFKQIEFSQAQSQNN